MKMIVNSAMIGAIFVAHIVLFTLMYYGRIQGLSLCGSDSILFGFPFLMATAAYTKVIAGMINAKKRWHRMLFIGFVVAWIGAVSAVAGMSVAFTLLGT